MPQAFEDLLQNLGDRFRLLEAENRELLKENAILRRRLRSSATDTLASSNESNGNGKVTAKQINGSYTSSRVSSLSVTLPGPASAVLEDEEVIVDVDAPIEEVDTANSLEKSRPVNVKERRTQRSQALGFGAYRRSRVTLTSRPTAPQSRDSSACTKRDSQAVTNSQSLISNSQNVMKDLLSSGYTNLQELRRRKAAMEDPSITWTKRWSLFFDSIMQRDHLRMVIMESVMTVVICVNSFIIGIRSDYNRYWHGWLVFEIIFCIAYTVESSVKMFVWRWNFIYGPDRYWNALDCSIVALAIMEIILE
jgi:hypothetical protein